jgi:hypothetical protein
MNIMIQNIFSTLQYILSIVALSRDAVAIYMYHIILYGRYSFQLFVPLIPYTFNLSWSLIKPTLPLNDNFDSSLGVQRGLHR